MGSSDSNLLIGMTLTGLMGFFIQRGGTCIVAAIKQILQLRQFARLMPGGNDSLILFMQHYFRVLPYLLS
jgi:hypothetical protein